MSLVLICLLLPFRCLSLLFLSSTLLFPSPRPSPRWPVPVPVDVTGPPLDPRCEQEMTHFLGHFCHSPNATQGGWPLQWPMLERPAPMQAVTPVVQTTNARSLHFTDRPFFPPNSPWSSAVFPSSFLSMTIHVKTMCANQRWQAKIAAVKYGWFKTSWLNSGPSQASAMVTDTWCIRSHWKELQICFLDSSGSMGYTASTSVFTNVSLALNGIPQLARSLGIHLSL